MVIVGKICLLLLRSASLLVSKYRSVVSIDMKKISDSRTTVLNRKILNWIFGLEPRVVSIGASIVIIGILAAIVGISNLSNAYADGYGRFRAKIMVDSET